jgi:hypothetical protein
MDSRLVSNVNYFFWSVTTIFLDRKQKLDDILEGLKVAKLQRNATR